MEKVSLLIKNAQVFNTYLKKFVPADVSVLQGKFYYIDRENPRTSRQRKSWMPGACI